MKAWEVKDEKNKIQGLQWLDEALKWYNRENLELRKERWTNEIKNFDESPE